MHSNWLFAMVRKLIFKNYIKCTWLSCAVKSDGQWTTSKQQKNERRTMNNHISSIIQADILCDNEHIQRPIWGAKKYISIADPSKRYLNCNPIQENSNICSLYLRFDSL